MPWDELFEHCVEYPLKADEHGPRGGGVYLLTDEQDRMILLAAAGDMGRALRHRLEDQTDQPDDRGAEPGSVPPMQPESEGVADESRSGQPTDSQPADDDQQATAADRVGSGSGSARPSGRRKLNLGEITRRIRWQRADSAFEIAYEYHRIAREALPSNYRENLGHGPCSFVHIDPTAAIPRLSISREIRPGGGTTLGPFATAADASRFVQSLQDAFDLCRYEHILQLAPKGQACAYFEMGRCPAPCDGTAPMQEYRQQVAAALSYALGERGGIQQHWREQMQAAAAEKAFEWAGVCKQRLERARQLEHDAFRHVRDVRELSYLVVQRGGGRTRFKPFLVAGGLIQPGEVVGAKELPTVLPIWRERTIQMARETLTLDLATVSPEHATLLTEHIWLLSHFLFKRETSGAYLHWRNLPAADELAQMPLFSKSPSANAQAAQSGDSTDDLAAAGPQ